MTELKAGDIVRITAKAEDLPHPQCRYSGQLGKIVYVDDWYHVAAVGAVGSDAFSGVPFEGHELRPATLAYESWPGLPPKHSDVELFEKQIKEELESSRPNHKTIQRLERDMKVAKLAN